MRLASVEKKASANNPERNKRFIVGEYCKFEIRL